MTIRRTSRGAAVAVAAVAVAAVAFGRGAAAAPTTTCVPGPGQQTAKACVTYEVRNGGSTIWTTHGVAVDERVTAEQNAVRGGGTATIVPQAPSAISPNCAVAEVRTTYQQVCANATMTPAAQRLHVTAFGFESECWIVDVQARKAGPC